jgi:protease-4
MSEKKISFGKIFWPSFLAVFIMSIIGLLIFGLILGGIIGRYSDFGPKPLATKNNTVLHITLDGEIAENSSSSFVPSNFSIKHVIGLSDVLYGLEHAKTDNKIKGILLEINELNCGYTTAREIRNAINDFEKCGKFVIAYNSGEVITQKEYYVSSAANKVYGFPSSAMEFAGLGAELAFFKGTLEKLDVEVQVIRGSNNDFKSAVEPFFRSHMSDSSRVQINRFITSMWEDIRTDISADRNVSMDVLNDIADSLKIHRASDAVSLGLLDDVKYRDQVLDYISKKIGNDDGEKLHLQAFEKYAQKKFYRAQALIKVDQPNVAVILAEGDVSTDGDGLASSKICKLFQDARENKSVKTIVFRINSPGGSALASDEIWREVEKTTKLKKVVVSMGDVAASGGYYIAAPANYIFAEPTTITGSIGVFGMIPYTGKMFEKKLGITFDRVSTNKHSLMSPNRKLTREELAIVQEEVDTIYATFLKRVASGRKMTRDQVNTIARGRVWTGKDAIKIGLVDRLGGLKDAINYAAKKASLAETRVIYYPLKKEDKWDDFFEKIEGEKEVGSRIYQEKLPEEFLAYYNQLKKIESMTGIQMRIPFDITIK